MGEITQGQRFLEILGLDEEPMGLFYTDIEPEEGFAPDPSDLPSREKEIKNKIDWPGVFSKFSCAMGHIWRARRKKRPAFFSAHRFGCPGGAFWMGFLKPQTDTIINYVSSGIPNWTEGERYCESPEELKRIFEYIDPCPASEKYCVIKPMSLAAGGEKPELVIFFARPESLCGLHQLATFVTNDPEVVMSSWGAGCGCIVAWPLHYLSKSQNKAVLGGDPSARKFFKTDELSFTVPFPMYEKMVRRCDASFLTTKTWSMVKKKINRSKRVWKEGVPTDSGSKAE